MENSKAMFLKRLYHSNSILTILSKMILPLSFPESQEASIPPNHKYKIIDKYLMELLQKFPAMVSSIILHLTWKILQKMQTTKIYYYKIPS